MSFMHAKWFLLVLQLWWESWIEVLMELDLKHKLLLVFPFSFSRLVPVILFYEQF